MAGLKDRLLAPELVATFIKEYVAEVNAANRERGLRQAQLQNEHTKIGRRIRNLLDLMTDGQGSQAMVQELRALEKQQADFEKAAAEAGTPEPVPAIHPNVGEIYRRRVEALEDALRDPMTASAAAEMLRTLIDAILVFPGERRGEVTMKLRGDLAAFTNVPDADGEKAQKTALRQVASGRGREVVGTLVAGTGFEPVTFRL